LIKLKTVSFLTIFLAASTLKKNCPFSSCTKLDLKPLYIVRFESIGCLSVLLKYFPDLPISTKSNFLIVFFRALFRNASNCRGSFSMSLKTFTLVIFNEYSSPWWMVMKACSFESSSSKWLDSTLYPVKMGFFIFLVI